MLIPIAMLGLGFLIGVAAQAWSNRNYQQRWREAIQLLQNYHDAFGIDADPSNSRVVSAITRVWKEARVENPSDKWIGHEINAAIRARQRELDSIRADVIGLQERANRLTEECVKREAIFKEPPSGTASYRTPLGDPPIGGSPGGGAGSGEQTTLRLRCNRCGEPMGMDANKVNDTHNTPTVGGSCGGILIHTRRGTSVDRGLDLEYGRRFLADRGYCYEWNSEWT